MQNCLRFKIFTGNKNIKIPDIKYICIHSSTIWVKWDSDAKHLLAEWIHGVRSMVCGESWSHCIMAVIMRVELLPSGLLLFRRERSSLIISVLSSCCLLTSGTEQENHKIISRISVTRTLMAHLPWLFRTRS